MPAELKEVFGEEILDHTVVLLTCGDYLMGLTEEVTPFSKQQHFVFQLLEVYLDLNSQNV